MSANEIVIPRIEDIRLNKTFEVKVDVRTDAYWYHPWFLPKAVHPGAKTAELEAEVVEQSTREIFKETYVNPPNNRVKKLEYLDVDYIDTLKTKQVQFTLRYRLRAHSEREAKHWLGMVFEKYELDILLVEQCDLPRNRQ